MKFIHTADWQIGMKAAHVGGMGQRVREARLDAAMGVVDLATRHDAEFIIVAGDTFEDNAVDRVLVQKVADILGRFSRPVFVISGNHDPLVPGSVWDHASWAFHSNITILREARPVELDGATLYPCPLFEKHSLQDPTHWIDARDNAKIAIGIGHGTVRGVVQDEIDYPIDRDAAERSGLDYLGIGHWHSFATFPAANDVVRLAYSGTHETTKFGERDSGNAVLVEIKERGTAPKLTSYRTGILNWQQIERTFTESADVLKLREKIESFEETENTLLDVRMDGVLSPEDQVELTRMSELIKARFLYGRMDSSGLVARPQDDRWLDALPLGVIRETALRLRDLSDPQSDVDRQAFATPEVATRALLELFKIVQETQP